MVSASMLNPIIDNQYTAARAYFLCIIGMLLFESLLRAPLYLLFIYRKGMSANSLYSILKSHSLIL